MPESADDLFLQLEETLCVLPDFEQFYRALNKVFLKTLEIKTSVNKAVFVGPFAKTDYLLKEHSVSSDFSRNVNSMRVRFRRRARLDKKLKEKYHLVDFSILCRFVSVVFDAELPDSLSSKLMSFNDDVRVESVQDDKDSVYEVNDNQDYIRAIVGKWDNDNIYATADIDADNQEIVVCYSHGNRNYNYDWTYIRDLLYCGAQINIIRPRVEDGVYYPELIILDPDYLVDVTAISHCFANYAEGAIVNLINRISPSSNTEPILLGNLAGQFLDEEISHDESLDYSDCVMEFFHNNALNLLAADIGSDFHNQARKQKANVANAIRQTLPSLLTRFDRKNVMVEPSFFSEMFGIQGRMDFLQLDNKVLLEQKSGKGEWIPHDTDPKTPHHKEEHYVQMLLYMLILRYNYKKTFEQNNRELHAFLLYSKYENSLVGLGFSPELVFRALKVRNAIVALDMHLADENGYSLLENITPEKLNEKGVCNPLWMKCQYNQLAELLAPMQNASELERAYCIRMLQFVAREHLLSKIGNKTKENSGFANKWYDSIEEKLHAGNIFDNLVLDIDGLTGNDTDIQSQNGKIEYVKLFFIQNEAQEMSNFRPGDVVILYPYCKGEEPDVRRSMTFRCTIKEIKNDEIKLMLRSPQSDAHVFLYYEGMLWAIEHDSIESSNTALYRSIYSFFSATKERRDLILLQRKPVIDKSISLRGDYGSFNALSLKVKQARDLFLIIGPPGTGKTSFGMLNTVKEELLEPNSTILLTSYTNRAVDEICCKLKSEGIDFVRLGHSVSCSSSYKDNLLEERVLKSRNVGEVRSMLTKARIIIGTTATITANAHMLFKLCQFSLAVIDEASQILEPHLLGILSALYNDKPAIKKIVMIGDHKQLPAVVQQTPEESSTDNPLLNAIYLHDCRQSLFERLLRKYSTDEDVVYMLTRQGRMHYEIAKFPNNAFYQGKLQVVPLKHQEEILRTVDCNEDDILSNALFNRRVAFIDVTSVGTPASDKVNKEEAALITEMVRRIYEKERIVFSADETVGVIVPYRNQIATVRKMIENLGIPELNGITIDTVERYQGSQRRYIIYGFTIQKYYQLLFLTSNVFRDEQGVLVDRKLNVAMTRAEEHIVMLGNSLLLGRNKIFNDLISFCKGRGCYFVSQQRKDV